jgi:S-formylglutathione hydrolase FrmB
MSNTVVNYVDQNFRTIRDPRARAIMGMSEGGFCAPMLMLRHPDVYSVSISFSGYFWAAGSGSWNSSRPFLRDRASIDAHSPALLVSKIPSSDRSKLYFIIIAEAGQEFYGPGAAAFEKTLDSEGYRYLAIKSSYPHGWNQVRYQTPGVLKAWGAQLVINGIW